MAYSGDYTDIGRQSMDRRSRRSADRLSIDRRSVNSAVSVATPVDDLTPGVAVVPAQVVRVERTDSDLARELAAQLNDASVAPDPADEELARRLQEEARAAAPDPADEEMARRLEEEERLDRRSQRSAAQDADLAAAILTAEMAAIEDHQAEVEALNENFEYVRPKDYTPWFCYGVVAFTSLMMLVEIGTNGWKFEALSVNPLFGPSLETMDKLGAKNTQLILEGQFYRLFTPIVLHAGILHLFFNLLGLRAIGFPMEAEFGHWKIALIFVASGVVGVLLSAIFLPTRLGVGASGAIFGLFGAAWADLIVNWSLHFGSQKTELCQLSVATIFNLGLGLVPFLDNFAHFGGFITGIILGLTVLVQNTYDIWGYRRKRKTYQLVLQSLAITFLPILFVVLVLVLYLQVDAANSCQWCTYISCVPMPPGASDADLWWDCTECSSSADVQIQDLTQTSYSITCPDLSDVFVSNADNPTFSGQDVIDEVNNGNSASIVRRVCKDLCL